MGNPTYPTEVSIDGRTYVFERILHDHFYSVNVLYRNVEGGRQVLKLSDFRMFFGVLLRPFAGWMSRHEYRIYAALTDIPGIPALGPRLGRCGYFHAYIEGKTLADCHSQSEIPDDFFDRLAKIYRAIHERGIVHLDSDKRSNILLADDGAPYVIDFQVALWLLPNNRPTSRWRQKMFDRLVRSDVYHVYKHKSRLRRDLMREDEWALAVRPPANRMYDALFGRHVRFLKRLVYPKGSREPVWRRRRDDRHG